MIDISALCRNKKIIAISNYKTSKEIEDFAASYDFIIRFNKGSNEIFLNNYEFYNKRTDLCVLSGWRRGDFGPVEGFKNKNILFSRPKHEDKLQNFYKAISVCKKFENDIQKQTNEIDYIPVEIFYDLHKNYKYHHPTTGMITLYYLKKILNIDFDCINFFQDENLFNVFLNKSLKGKVHKIQIERKILEDLNIKNHLISVSDLRWTGNETPTPRKTLSFDSFKEKFTDNFNKIIVSSINDHYKEFAEYKSIIVCGNGTDGYGKDSADFIDSHDCVVRINNVYPNDELIGKKYQYLFAGGSSKSHLADNEFYPTIDKFKTIITTHRVIRKICAVKKVQFNNLIFYNRDLIINFLLGCGYEKHSKHISGIHCILLFLAIKQKFKIPIFNIIGFNKNNYCNSYLTYTHTKLDIDEKIQNHHNRHDWEYQNYLLDIIKDIK